MVTSRHLLEVSRPRWPAAVRAVHVGPREPESRIEAALDEVDRRLPDQFFYLTDQYLGHFLLGNLP